MITGAAFPRMIGQAWRRRPPATVRLRLTLLYGGLFLAVGIILVAITYALVARQLNAHAAPRLAPVTLSAPRLPGVLPQLQQDRIEQLQQRLAQALAQ